jgi:zinc transporter ZupT
MCANTRGPARWPAHVATAIIRRVTPEPQTLTVLLYSSLAAGAAALGVAPIALRGRLPLVAIGWANALASGLMLGVAYSLLMSGLAVQALYGSAGALLGIGFVYFTHAVTGTADLDLNKLGEQGPEYGYQVLLVETLHSAQEGIAIGAAMLVSLPFGISTAIALGVHNIPEATILSAILSERGVRLRHAAGLAVATNIGQILLAIVTYAVVTAAPVLLPWAIGFAVGALIYLVMVELLPESYRQAGHTSIALVTVVAMGIVVLLASGS